MTAQYTDKYGQWHARRCIDGEPAGNDGMILSAYAHKLGLEAHAPYALWSMLRKDPTCGYPIERLPGKATPFPSRDFFLGAAYFNMRTTIGVTTWNFSPVPLPKLNIVKLLIQLYKLRGKHRNTFWKESGYEQVYRLAFMVPLQDRAFYYRCRGISAPLIYRLIEWIDKQRDTDDTSSLLIRYLKYDQMPDSKVWLERFGKDHPFYKGTH